MKGDFRRLYGTPKPQDRESLASWMVRIAAFHWFGMNAIWEYLSRNEVGAPKRLFDFDVQLPDRFLLELSVLACIYLPNFEQYFRIRLLDNFAARVGQRRRWVPHLSKYKFCPECLKEEVPYFKEDWCLTYILTCPQHKLHLKIYCDNCEKSVDPSKYMYEKIKGNSRALRYCPFCETDLSLQAFMPIDPNKLNHYHDNNYELDREVWSLHIKKQPLLCHPVAVKMLII